MSKNLQRTAEGKSSATHLVSSSAASFPGRNEGPGVHSSLMVKDESEDSFCHRSQGV